MNLFMKEKKFVILHSYNLKKMLPKKSFQNIQLGQKNEVVVTQNVAFSKLDLSILQKLIVFL